MTDELERIWTMAVIVAIRLNAHDPAESEHSSMNGRENI